MDAFQWGNKDTVCREGKELIMKELQTEAFKKAVQGLQTLPKKGEIVINHICLWCKNAILYEYECSHLLQFWGCVLGLSVEMPTLCRSVCKGFKIRDGYGFSFIQGGARLGIGGGYAVLCDALPKGRNIRRVPCDENMKQLDAAAADIIEEYRKQEKNEQEEEDEQGDA